MHIGQSSFALGLAAFVAFAPAAHADLLTGPIVSPVNGQTYYLLTQADWTESEAQAEALGGHLATVNSEAENAWITSTFSLYGGLSRALWIGLNDAANEGHFVWASGAAVTYTNWAPGEANDHLGIEDWAHLFPPNDSRSPAWNDAPNLPDAFGFTFNGVVEVPTAPVPEPAGWWLMLGGAVPGASHHASTQRSSTGPVTRSAALIGSGAVGRGRGWGGTDALNEVPPPAGSGLRSAQAERPVLDDASSAARPIGDIQSPELADPKPAVPTG